MAICLDCMKLIHIDNVKPTKTFHYTRGRYCMLKLSNQKTLRRNIGIMRVSNLKLILDVPELYGQLGEIKRINLNRQQPKLGMQLEMMLLLMKRNLQV